MTAPRWYSTPDYLFPEGEQTLTVKARCDCGVRSVGSFRISLRFLARWRSGVPVRPDDLAGSSKCRDCKQVVKVTAGDLHLA